MDYSYEEIRLPLPYKYKICIENYSIIQLNLSYPSLIPFNQNIICLHSDNYIKELTKPLTILPSLHQYSPYLPPFHYLPSYPKVATPIFKKMSPYNIFAMEQAEQLDYQIYKEYQIHEKLGKGTYGIVYRGKHKRTGRTVAIKKIIDAFQNLIDAKRTYRELNYLLQLEHPCVVRLEHLQQVRRGPPHEPGTSRAALTLTSSDLRGSTTDKLAPPITHGKHVYAIFECMETDLAYTLQKCHQGLQPIQRKYIAYQLLHGLAYLHRSGLVHRDIKPSNLLLNCKELELKICDFGMARLKVEGEGTAEGVLTEYVASRWYRPPEGLLGITTCSESIDMWSAGCVIAELVLKAPLFRGKSTIDQLELILKCIGMPSPKQIDKLPSEDARFMLKNFSFSRRSKMRTLQQTLSGCTLAEIDLIMNLLRFDPQARVTAEQALKHEYFADIRTMNAQIQRLANHSTKILDFSLRKIQKAQGERYGGNPGIQHYRLLIEELEKFAERSTNRSGNMGNPSSQGHTFSKGDQTMQFDHQQDHSSSNHQPFKEKSTKQSEFVTINKHHYLSSTASLFQNHEEQKILQKEGEREGDREGEEKTKAVADLGKMHKMKKKKAVSKADIMERTHTGMDKSQKGFAPSKKETKKQKLHHQKISKPEVKERKALTVSKKTESIHRNLSTKNLIRQRHESVNQKKILLLYTQPLPKKRQSQQKDSKLILSKSSSSLYRFSSKEKGHSRPSNPNQKLKLNPKVKIFLKPSLNLNKSAILKCKSPKFPTQIKKNP